MVLGLYLQGSQTITPSQVREWVSGQQGPPQHVLVMVGHILQSWQSSGQGRTPLKALQEMTLPQGVALVL